MSKKTLLLDSNYQVQSFIDIRKVLKFLIKDKVEVLYYWDEAITYSSGSIQYPSVLRLINPFKRNYLNINSNFSRKAVIKRDNGHCQYCNKNLSYSAITIDHVIPRAHGGQNSFTNCVVACQACNNKKGNLTLEQSKMVLIKKPQNPLFFTLKNLHCDSEWNKDWNNFIIE